MLFAFAGLDAVDDVDFFVDVVDLPGAHAKEEVAGSGAVCPADISRPEGEAAVTRKDVDLAEGVQHLIPVLGFGRGPVDIPSDRCGGIDVDCGGVFPMFTTPDVAPFNLRVVCAIATELQSIHFGHGEGNLPDTNRGWL